MRTVLLSSAGLVVCLLAVPTGAAEPLLAPQPLLDRETFWDNRDWDWYRANVPFFECPDADIQTTYYYRWELLTKHLTYGSANSGYSFTEFIDRPFWSGAYERFRARPATTSTRPRSRCTPTCIACPAPLMQNISRRACEAACPLLSARLLNNCK